MWQKALRQMLVWFCGTVMGILPALAADAGSPALPPRTVADISQLLNQYPLDAAKQQAIQAALDLPVPVSGSKPELARFYKSKAGTAEQIGAMKLYAENMRKVVELGGEEDINDDLYQLALAELYGGNFVSALGAAKNAIAGIKIDANPGKASAVYGILALVHARLGDLSSAKVAMMNADRIHKNGLSKPWASRFIHAWTMLHETSQGDFLLAQGKLANGEAALRHSIEEIPMVIEEAKRERGLRAGTYFSDTYYEYLGDTARAKIAAIMIKQGRLTDAEIVVREALTNSVRRSGRYSYYSGSLIKPFVQVLISQGRYVEAEQLALVGLDIFKQIGTPVDSPAVIDLRRELGTSYVAQGRFQDAQIEFQTTQDSLSASLGRQAKAVLGDVAWSLALLKTNRPDESLAMLDQLIEKTQQWLGEEHLDTMELIGVKAMALAARNDKSSALKAFRKALPALLGAAISEGDEPSPLRSGRLRLILEAYLSLLGEIRGTPMETAAGIDAASEAFRLTDALRSQSTQGAVAASAARAAANDPAIGKLIRSSQDLSQESLALQRILRDLMGQPPDQQLPKVIADMQTRVEVIQRDRSALTTELSQKFPAYANLIHPQPPTLAQTQAALKPGEALLNIFSTDTSTYLWAIRKDGPSSFATVSLGRKELARRVQVLRQSLDPGNVDLAKGIPPFDLDAAWRLYVDLLQPVAGGWQGAKHLLVVTGDALGQLPLALLLTEQSTAKPDGALAYDHFRDLAWMLRQAAFTQLPSVNALLALRSLPPASASRRPFIGFGDPQFALVAASAVPTAGLRNLALPRPSQRELAQASSPDWMDYAKIPPLPDTRDEILALARALKADPNKDAYLGVHASTANVMKLNLVDRRVVAFATHGLLPGDFPGVSEPSLALANPGGGHHGLLTLEDILRLKLDADWVVLSACNTAAGDGQGVDALTGLGRAFFYAGTRALLVTHWPVESASARLLVTGIFERQAADATLSRAEALRQSMLALMQQASAPEGGFSYAHPLFWGPYAVVGEGGL